MYCPDAQKPQVSDPARDDDPIEHFKHSDDPIYGVYVPAKHF
jgi:hypothetical protein